MPLNYLKWNGIKQNAVHKRGTLHNLHLQIHKAHRQNKYHILQVSQFVHGT